jgi:hypothetical protein
VRQDLQRGLITQCRVLEGNPADEHQVQPSLQRDQLTFGQPPELIDKSLPYQIESGKANLEGTLASEIEAGRRSRRSQSRNR